MSRKCGGAVNIPAWVRDLLVIYLPDKTVFAPRPFLRMFQKQPHLLDCNDHAYPLGDCDRLRLEHLTRGIALLITENQPLTLYPHPGCWFVITDGRRKLGIAPIFDESQQAARVLAEFFNGVVVPEEVEA